MEKNLMRGVLAPLISVAMLSLTGCGDSSDPTTYTVGGAVSGLSTDEDVTLLNNGGEAVVVAVNGGFTFSPGQASGSTYDVTVKSHMPGIMCSVSNGSGMVAASNVTSVAVSCAAGAETVVHSFAGAPNDGAGPLDGGLLIDSAGNFYGTTDAGGEFDGGTVFEISPAGVETLVYSFVYSLSSPLTDIPNPAGQLVMDAAGNIYGTTLGGGVDHGGTVFKIDLTTSTESIVYSFPGGTSTSPGANPRGLVMDAAGNLYGTTYGGGAYGYGTVFKISSNGVETVLHSFAGGQTDGANPSDGVIMDGAGNLYGTTAYGGASGYGAAFKIGPTGVETVLHSFAGPYGDGTNPDAGLIMDSNGNLYGTTPGGGASGGGSVFKIDPTTAEESIVHSFDCVSTDGCAPVGGLIMDSAGNLYGTTGGGGTEFAGTVFKINPTTGKETVLYSFVSTVGSTDGKYPAGQLVIDGAGNLYGTTYGGGVYDQGTLFMID